MVVVVVVVVVMVAVVQSHLTASLARTRHYFTLQSSAIMPRWMSLQQLTIVTNHHIAHRLWPNLPKMREDGFTYGLTDILDHTVIADSVGVEDTGHDLNDGNHPINNAAAEVEVNGHQPLCPRQRCFRIGGGTAVSTTDAESPLPWAWGAWWSLSRWTATMPTTMPLPVLRMTAGMPLPGHNLDDRQTLPR